MSKIQNPWEVSFQMKHSTIQNKIKTISIILFWLIIWQIISFGLPKLLFASPIQVIESLVRLIRELDFWRAIGHSFLKIGIGFFSAFLSGALFALLAFHFPILDELGKPILQMMKAMPVASFIIVALIWISSSQISILISFVVSFPITYISMLDGLKELNKKLIEMAGVFRVSRKKRFLKLYLPQIFPYLASGLKMSAGMSWKAGIAGEILGLPKFSIGENLYLAKLYLNTADLFAWTAVIILLSFLFEKILMGLLRLIDIYFIKGKIKRWKTM